MAFLTPDDLQPFAQIDPLKAYGMIEDATALAVLAAPCLADEDALTVAQFAAVRAILRGAVLRWNEVRAGAMMSADAGPFGQSYDNGQTRRTGMFWPSEIDQLQGICRAETDSGGGAFAIDTLTSMYAVVHADICTLNFGGLYCSCGAVLTGAWPLWEVGY